MSAGNAPNEPRDRYIALARAQDGLEITVDALRRARSAGAESRAWSLLAEVLAQLRVEAKGLSVLLAPRTEDDGR